MENLKSILLTMVELIVECESHSVESKKESKRKRERGNDRPLASSGPSTTILAIRCNRQ